MGCAAGSQAGLSRALSSMRPSAQGAQGAQGGHSAADGPRRLSMRPHSLETRILQIDQVDTLVMDPPRSDEPEAPFEGGQLGLRDPKPQHGTLFRDPDFPADDAALGLTATPSDVRWSRPSVFDGGEGVPVQGAVRVKLWRFGRWETVVVDDRLPHPLSMATDAEGELWPALLEKAFAKYVTAARARVERCRLSCVFSARIHGSYAGLSGGDVLWGLEDLTGGLCQRLHVPDVQPPPLPQGTLAPGLHVGPLSPVHIPRERDSLYGQVFRPLMHALRYGAFVSCTPRGSQHQVSSGEIIVSTVVDTKLTIRGPQLCVHDDTGSPPQWWNLEDFAKAYTNIIVTTLSTELEGLQVLEVFGQWESGISTGGSRNNLEKFAINPQYILKVNQPEEHEENKDFGRCSLLVALMQEHRRSTRGFRPPLLPIAYFIYKADTPTERLSAEYFLCVPEEIDSGPFRNTREIEHQAELEPGNYVVIPATWSPGQQGGFLLRIFAARKITLEALPPYKPMCAMLPTWVPETDT